MPDKFLLCQAKDAILWQAQLLLHVWTGMNKCRDMLSGLGILLHARSLWRSNVQKAAGNDLKTQLDRELQTAKVLHLWLLTGTPWSINNVWRPAISFQMQQEGHFKGLAFLATAMPLLLSNSWTMTKHDWCNNEGTEPGAD